MRCKSQNTECSSQCKLFAGCQTRRERDSDSARQAVFEHLTAIEADLPFNWTALLAQKPTGLRLVTS